MDARLHKRYQTLVAHGCQTARLGSSIKIPFDHQQTHSHTQALWRFLSNPRVQVQHLAQPLLQNALQGARDHCHDTALIMHDWSMIALPHDNKPDRLQRTHPHDIGYELQSSLLVSDHTALPDPKAKTPPTNACRPKRENPWPCASFAANSKTATANPSPNGTWQQRAQRGKAGGLLPRPLADRKLLQTVEKRRTANGKLAATKWRSLLQTPADRGSKLRDDLAADERPASAKPGTESAVDTHIRQEHEEKLPFTAPALLAGYLSLLSAHELLQEISPEEIAGYVRGFQQGFV